MEETEYALLLQVQGSSPGHFFTHTRMNENPKQDFFTF